jgi:hypothetical protein
LSPAMKWARSRPLGSISAIGVSSGLILPQSHRFEFPIAARAGAVD